MGNVLCQLLLQTRLFGFLCYVIDRNLETAVLKDDAFQCKDSATLLDFLRHPLHFLVVLPFVLGNELGNRFQLGYGKDFFHVAEVLVGNEVDILLEQQVDKNFFFLFGKYAQSFVRNLKVGNQFLAFDVKRFFGAVQPMINLDDVGRDFSQFILRK